MKSLKKYWILMMLKCFIVYKGDYYFKYIWKDYKNKEYIVLNLKCGKFNKI